MRSYIWKWIERGSVGKGGQASPSSTISIVASPRLWIVMSSISTVADVVAGRSMNCRFGPTVTNRLRSRSQGPGTRANSTVAIDAVPVELRSVTSAAASVTVQNFAESVCSGPGEPRVTSASTPGTGARTGNAGLLAAQPTTRRSEQIAATTTASTAPGGCSGMAGRTTATLAGTSCPGRCGSS